MNGSYKKNKHLSGWGDACVLYLTNLNELPP